MKAERVVIDTNVLISAALVARSAPAAVTFEVLEQGILLFSAQTFAELETRLWRPKFDKYLSLEQRRALLHDFSAAAEWIAVDARQYPAFSRDPDDDMFIHTALAGRAEWLISGDNDLLELPPIEGLSILSPAQALTFIGAERPISPSPGGRGFSCD